MIYVAVTIAVAYILTSHRAAYRAARTPAMEARP